MRKRQTGESCIASVSVQHHTGADRDRKTVSQHRRGNALRTLCIACNNRVKLLHESVFCVCVCD